MASGNGSGNGNGNGSAVRAKLADIIIWLFRIITPVAIIYVGTLAKDIYESAAYIEDEMRYQTLRMYNLEDKAQIQPPKPWFERRPGYY